MAGTESDNTLPAAGGASPTGFGPETRAGGRYRIVRFLAKGGMGEVFEAEDLVLDGKVALKALHADLGTSGNAVERLRREVALGRKVTHPGICRLHDVGEHEGRIFFTMELLAGETLAARIARGPLEVAELARIASRLVGALAALHAAGIVHRDLKPSNVILDGERVVVTDFGLARSTALDAEQLTAEAAILGTPAYMAPEQVEGREATPASDVYALGVLLFEAGTGRLPFREDTPMATATARLHKDPPAAGIDARWDAVIRRCLARDPAARFARVEDVLAAPRGVTRRWLLAAGGAGALGAGLGAWWLARSGGSVSAPAAALRSLVLLPLAGIPEDAVAFAVNVDLHDALSRIAGLELISFTGANMLPELDATISELTKAADPVASARALDFDGQVRFALDPGANRWTLSAELTRAHGAGWTGRWSRPPTEASALVDDAATAIARAVGHAAPSPSDTRGLGSDVYERYGRALLGYFFFEGPPEALEALAPELPRAGARYAELVASFALQSNKELELASRARDAASRVLDVEPSSALALAARGLTSVARWEWAAADADLSRAVELAPGLDRVLFHRAFQLHLIGRFDEAIAIGDRIAARSPRSPGAQAIGATFLYWSRRYTEAIPRMEAAIAMGDAYWSAVTLSFLSRAYAELAEYQEAIAAADRLLALSEDVYWNASLVAVFALAGQLERAESLRAELAGADLSPYVMATVHAMLGEHDEAIPLFTRALDGHDTDALFLKIEPLPPAMRADPRFQALLARMGFPA